MASFSDLMPAVMAPSAARRLGSLALIGLITVAPVSAGEKMAGPRDPRMRRIVSDFEAAVAGVPGQFQADLARILAGCRRDCEWEPFARSLANSAALAERKLTAALRAADGRLKERARAVKGLDGVLGAAGDLSRGVASLEMSSLRVAAEMTESLSALKGAGFGGQPLLTTLQLRLASLVVHVTSVALALTFIAHTAGSPTAYVYIGGYAPAESPVTLQFTCGSGAPQTNQTVTNDDGRWGVATTVALSGSNTCAVTATAGTGLYAGSISFEIHIP